MSCEVCSFDAAADSVMWACVGCSRKFHAACIGVHAQSKSLRNKDKKKIDVTSYVLPCCGPCQNLITANFEFNTLVEQQAKLADQINKNTEVTHRSTVHQNNMSILHEAIDRQEGLLIDIKKQLTTTGSGNVSSGIKNHITSLFDIAMQNFKENINTTLNTVMSDMVSTKIADNMKHTFTKLENQLEAIQHSVFEVGSKEIPSAELLVEVKMLSNAVAAMQLPETAVLDNSLELTLAEELAQELSQYRDNSGWRLLDNNKIWKADWQSYDLKQLRRHQQEKAAQKARNRRKRNNKNNNSNNNNNKNRGINNNWNLITKNARNRNFTSNTNINNIPPSTQFLSMTEDRFSRSPPRHHTVRFQRWPAPYPNPADNEAPSTSQPQDSRSWMLRMAPGYADYVNCSIINHSNNNRDTNNSNNNNKDQRNHGIVSRQNGNPQLPPDRDLLAAAKDRFSRPPANYQPAIQFRRGEILNPYPANVNFQPSGPTHSLNRTTPPSSCDACSCRHSCFQPN